MGQSQDHCGGQKNITIVMMVSEQKQGPQALFSI